MFIKEEKVFRLAERKPIVDESLLSQLDEEQIKPASVLFGPVLVKAGAGSGKTRVLTYRVANMIKNGILPNEILLLTFTNKAAKEMMERVKAILGTEPKGLVGGTYHHVGNMMLRKYAKLVGLTSSYTILDDEDAVTLMKMAVADSGIDISKSRLPKEKVIREINSLSINKNMSIPEIIKLQFPQFQNIENEIISIVDHFSIIKRKQNVVDFDDILVLWLKLLKDYPEIRNKYANEKFRFKLIDEFQDTNFIQYEIIKLLAGNEKNVLVVGDANQSIYRWRGAEVDNIFTFEEDFPECKTFTVSYNYRSTPEILSFANNSIKHNQKNSGVYLKSKSNKHLKPFVMRCPHSSEEASFVAQQILHLRDEGVSLKQIGVLYRSHFVAKELEMELAIRNIPYIIYSGLNFFLQKHIKDALAFVKIMENYKDTISWTRILNQLDGIGSKTSKLIVSKLMSYDNFSEFLNKESDFSFIKRGKESFAEFMKVFNGINSNDKPSDIIHHFLINYYDQYIQFNFENPKERKRDIESLIEFSAKYKSVPKFLEEITLVNELYGEQSEGEENKEEEKVSLMTIHKAKGLEWDYVFLIGAMQKVFPSELSLGDKETFEEERRLFYVASTRAKKELYISYPTKYFDFKVQGYVFTQPSIFIQEVNPELFENYSVQ